MVIKVYGPVRAACPQRVLACLIELEQDFQLVHVDLDAFEHKQPQFLLLQPFGQVPVIEDGDFKLYESRAIIRYLVAKHPDHGTKLQGKTLEERALIDQWLEVEAHSFNHFVQTIVLNLLVFPKMGKDSDVSAINSCKQQLEQVLDVYDKRLTENKYLAGDSFTLADLSHLPATRYLMNECGLGDLIRKRKNLNAWWEDISNRPAWKKVVRLADY